MRLRLNTTLRAALIAAISAVGFTLTQAQAEDVQLSGVTPTALNSSTAGNSGLNWTEDTGNLTSWRLTFTLTETRDSVADNVLLGTNGSTSSAGGDLLKILSDGSFKLEAGGSNITTSAGEIESGGTATVVLEYIADYNQYDVSLNKGTYNLTVNNGEVKSLVVSNDNNTNFLKGTGSNTRLWTNSKKEWYSDITLWQLDNNIIQVTASQWKGQSGANEWVSSNFQPEFSTGKDVVFDATGYNTVVVKDAVQAGVVTVSGAAYTFNIQSTGSLSATQVNVGDGGSATLTGEGTYILPSGSTSLGSVSLGEGWAGAVRISNVSSTGNGTHLENLFRGNSWVEVNGIKGGFLPQWTGGNLAANIILTNPDGGVAWKWSDGSSSEETLITFSGTWKGAGTFFKDTNNKRQGYKYTGNISGWTGDFRAKASETTDAVTKLEFAGSANDVRLANIQNEGVAALNIVLSTGGSMSVASNISKTGTGAVNISLTNSTAATLSGTVVADSLTIDSGSSLTNTGALTLNGSVSFGNAPIVNNGTVTFGANVVFDLSTLTASGNKYTLFSGTNTANLSGLGMSNIINYSAGASYVFGTDGTISFTKSASKVWTGVEESGEGNWNYEDSNWNGEQFKAGDIAEFNDYAKVTVNAAVQAGGITTTGNALVTIENDEATPGSLSSPSVELADETYLTSNISIANVASYSVGTGAVWLIGGDQTLAAGSGTNNGTIMVSGSLTFTGTATAADVANVSNYGGTVSVNFGSATARVDMEDSIGTLDVQGGTIDYRSKLGGQTLQLGSGTKLLFGDKDGAVDAPDFTNDIVLTGNATIQVHGNSKHSSVTISGDVTGEGHTLTKTDGNQNLTFSGKVNIGGLSTADNGSGTIIFAGGEGSLGKISTPTSVTVRFSAKNGEDNVYTFDTFAMAPSGSGTRWLIVDEGVTVHGTGNNLGDDHKATIMNSWGVNGGGLEVNGTLTTDGVIGMDAGSTNATIKGTGIINTAGLNLCNYTTTAIQGGITINITSAEGIYKRNNKGTVQLKDATLKAVDTDWSIKNGGNDYTVALADASTGTTFDAATGRTITIDNVLSGDGKLVKAGAGDLVMKKANTYTGDTIINAGKVVASNDSALGSTGAVTIAEDGALEVNAALNLGGRLQSNGAIIVNANKSLTLTEGSSINEAINNSGTVNLTAISLGDGFVEQGGGTGYYDVSGNKLADDTVNHYVGTNESYVQVVNNAQGATSTGTAVWKQQTISLETDGRIVTGSGAPVYDTFYIVAGSENISDIAKNNTSAINVSAGALVVDKVTSGITITVTDEGTISGDKADAKQVNIAEGATAYYTGGVEDSGVKFTPSELLDGAVEVDNYGQTQKYSIASRDLSVAAAALEMTGTEDVTVSNYVVVNKLVNTTGKVLTLDNVDALMLTDMSITNSTVQVYTNLAKDKEATVAIAGILQGGGATLKADLTLFGGSTLDVDGGDTNALTLGSTLAIDTTDGLVNLDEDTIAALNALEVGQSLDLIKALQGTHLEYDGAAAGAQWYGDLFNRAEGLVGDYTVYTTGDAFGLTRFNNVPEPTTGTLSLLALAALAARRRRK